MRERKMDEVNRIGAGRYREWCSEFLAVIFYVMFIVFVWYAIYMKSLHFYTGVETGFPDGHIVIAREMVGSTLWTVVYAVGAMTLYGFLFGRSEQGRKFVWNFPRWLQALLLFGFSFYLRCGVIDLIGTDTVQVMDFARAFEMSLETGSIFADVDGINFYRAFPNWALHVRVLHEIFECFPKEAMAGNAVAGIWYNALLSSLSVVLLYLIISISTKKDVFAIIAALLFSCWPFYLYYIILLSPDFAFVFFCLLGLLLIVIARCLVKSFWLQLTLYGIAGAILSVAGFFKSIDKILIISIGICGVLWLIAKGRWNKVLLRNSLLVIFIFFVTWAGMGKILYHQIEDYVGGPSNRNVAPYFLNVGMNPESCGQWSSEVLDEYLEEIRKTDYEFEAVNRFMNERLKERVKIVKGQTEAGDSDQIAAAKDQWQFFDSKLQKTWANNEGIRFVTQTIGKENPLHGDVFYEKYYPFMQAYQVAVAFLMILGGLAALVCRERKVVMICALMVFGFALLLLISEVQPRYKAVVFPFMATVAAYGVYETVYGLGRLIQGMIRMRRESLDKEKGGSQMVAEE